MTQYSKLIIRNRDNQSRKFRPSDWADRMASIAASFDGGRLKYDARVMPCKRCDDTICLRVDRAIADEQPHVLQTISDFMVMHNLEDFAPQCPEHRDAVAKAGLPDSRQTEVSLRELISQAA